MSSHRFARVLFRLLVLVMGCALLVGGGLVFHKYRRQAAAHNALVTGKAAYEAREYTRAAVNLGRYLTVCPRDTEILLLYADSQLRRRPRPPGSIQQALNAWESVLREQPGNHTAAERLLELYAATESKTEVERIARAWMNAPGIDPASRTKARLWLIPALLAQQKLDEADRAVHEWLAQSPRDPAALRAQAHVLAARKQPDEAVAVLATAAEAQPDDVATVSQLAFLLLEHKKDQAAAEKLLNDVVEKCPRSLEARLARAGFLLQIILADRRPAPDLRTRAVQDLESAHDLAGGDVNVLMNLASMLSQVGLVDKAVSVLSRAESLAPTITSLYVQHGRLVLEAEDAASAAATASRALAAPLGEQRMDVLPTVAELYILEGQPGRARKTIDDLRAAEPEPEVLLYLEAALDLLEGRSSKGIAKLLEVVHRDPKHIQAHLRLGRALAEAGDPRRAAQALHTCIQLKRAAGRLNTASAIQLELAQLYARFGHWDEARATAGNTDLRLADPGFADQVQLVRTELECQVARRQGQAGMATLEKCQGAVEDMIRQAPDPLAWKLLEARLKGWRAKLEEAETILNAIKAEAGDHKIELARIDLYADAGRFEQAAAVCQSLIESADGTDGLSLKLRLAELHAAAGDLEKACKLLESLAGQSPRAAQSSVRIALARLLVRNQQPERAHDVLVQVINDDSENLAACLFLLDLLPAEGTRPSRQDIVDRLRQIEGEKGPNARYWQALVWLEREDWAGRRNEIESLLTQCLAEGPAWEAPAVALGGLYEKAGEHDKALAAYGRFLTINPGSLAVAHRLLPLAQRTQQWEDMDRALRSLPADEPSLEPYRLTLALARGQIDRAGSMLEERIKTDPRDFASRLQLALLNLQSDNLPEAERLVAEAMRIAPHAPEVFIARARLHVRKGEHDQALRLCNEALAGEPQPDLLQLRSRVHEIRGDREAAAKDLRNMAEMEGLAERGFLALGQFHVRQGQPDLALASWREGLAAVPGSVPLRMQLAGMLLADSDEPRRTEGLRILEDLLVERPGDIALLLMRAEHLARTRPGEGEKALEEIIRKYPNSAEAYRGAAQVAISRGRLDRARELAEKGLNANPRDVELLLLRSQILLEKSPQLAVVSARQAMEIQPTNEKAAIGLADALAKSGDIKRAVELLEQFLQKSEAGPGRAVNLALARLHIQNSNFQAADALIRQFERHSPESSAAAQTWILWHEAQAHWGAIAELANECQKKSSADIQTLRAAARALVSSGQPAYQEKGISLLRDIAQQRPEDAAGYLELGAACYAAGKLVETIYAYEQALKIDPGNVGILNDLAWILCEDLKDPHAAIEWGQKALSAAPEDPHVLDTWGVLQFRLGRFQESREALQKCIAQETVSPATKASASFHLGRTLAKLDLRASRNCLEELFRNLDLERQLSDAARQEARSLLAQLSATNQP